MPKSRATTRKRSSVVGRDLVGCLAGHLAGEVEAGHDRQAAGGGAQRLDVAAVGRDDAAHRPLLAEVAREGARVDAAHGEHAAVGEPLEPPPARGAVVAVVRELADDDGPGVRPGRLVARRIDAVVADQREGEGDHLAGVRGIGDDLLVARHAGVEDELAADRAPTDQGLAGERRAVLEDDERGLRHRPPTLPGRLPGSASSCR